MVVSSFLKIGITFANLRLSGKMPVFSDWFMIRARGMDTGCDIRFSNMEEMLSWPLRVFDFDFAIVCMTSVGEICLKVNLLFVLCLRYC